MNDPISAQMADAHQPPAEDVGRVDVPLEVRDLANRIRQRSAAANRAISGLWSTTTAIETAKTDLLQLAEDALAAHRLLR